MVRQRDPRKGVPFFLTYHPLFKSMGKIINKNLNLLYMDNKIEKVFSLNQWFHPTVQESEQLFG